jgi:hypothetical protein
MGVDGLRDFASLLDHDFQDDFDALHHDVNRAVAEAGGPTLRKTRSAAGGTPTLPEALRDQVTAVKTTTR